MLYANYLIPYSKFAFATALSSVFVGY